MQFFFWGDYVYLMIYYILYYWINYSVRVAKIVYIICDYAIGKGGKKKLQKKKPRKKNKKKLIIQ